MNTKFVLAVVAILAVAVNAGEKGDKEKKQMKHGGGGGFGGGWGGKLKCKDKEIKIDFEKVGECNAKCALTEMGGVKDGKLNMKGIQTWVKDNLPEEVQKTANEKWKTCGEESEEAENNKLSAYHKCHIKSWFSICPMKMKSTTPSSEDDD